MILRAFTLTLAPENPLHFSGEELRSFFQRLLVEYPHLHNGATEDFIHRYPAVQCKQVKGVLMVIGISQGADLLRELSAGKPAIPAGGSSCMILEKDPAIREEEFGIMGRSHSYEFLTPWRALNQQNAKKFYHLTGKPARDSFMQKILAGHLATLAKSLDYEESGKITCEAKVRFRRDTVDGGHEMVFLGTFRTNLQIPEYFGIGQSVSQGFGTVRELPVIPEQDSPGMQD
jgi:hypothetical protein